MQITLPHPARSGYGQAPPTPGLSSGGETGRPTIPPKRCRSMRLVSRDEAASEASGAAERGPAPLGGDATRSAALGRCASRAPRRG